MDSKYLLDLAAGIIVLALQPAVAHAIDLRQHTILGTKVLVVEE